MISLEINQDATAEVSGNEIKVTGKLGTNTRKFNDTLIDVRIDGGRFVIESKKDIKKMQKKAMKIEQTMAGELSNDMEGVGKYFEIDMQIVFAHFPITIEVADGIFYIKNMIGERAKRSTRIIGNTKVEASGQKVRIYGTNNDNVTQTAANIRKICKIRHKDSRVFQDGVYYSKEEK
ncbi:MAG: 50S ribosomal protein L6 [Candidatus Marsarchaeota archaeon]|nr:50S ribosomal protein L6 [Candidatus Marsarchaeota archaeon]MCL5106044.1 50S ribosomal protein L6 [Candidatus Marsarchaeota archaeon]